MFSQQQSDLSEMRNIQNDQERNSCWAEQDKRLI